MDMILARRMTKSPVLPPHGEVFFQHEPVLAEEVASLVPPHAHFAVDLTVGGGSHSRLLLEQYFGLEVLSCDRDPQAVQSAQQALGPFGKRVLVKLLEFSSIAHHVLPHSVDFILADLGVSSPQLDQGERGFSFLQDGPLDMRMNPDAGGVTAAHLVNTAPPERLVDLFRRLGEERFAPQIVRAIVEARGRAPIRGTGELAQIVAKSVPAKFRRRGHHPATQVFQALRIEVNQELEQLRQLLDVAPDLLAPGGRLAVISFHSLEDRIVKDTFRRWEQPCQCPPDLPRCVCGLVPIGIRVTRKAIVASAAEQARNPRSRSARLRCTERRV